MTSGPQFLDGNSITLLETGQEYFPLLLSEIAAAKHEISLETYIFADDPVGHAVSGALAAAARRGVRVRTLVDGFGSRAFVDRIMPTLVAAGVSVLLFRREIRTLRLRRHRLRRMHRKLVVIDRRLAFVGGINLADDFESGGTNHPRHDYAVRIEGPLLVPIVTAMRQLWNSVRWATLRRRPRPQKRTVAVEAHPAGTTQAAFVVRDSIRHRRDIEEVYLDAIAAARHEILIASAYFLPGRRFRQAILDAAQRGVRVILLLQGRVEYLLLHYATQALYPQLLRGGVHLHEYQPSFLHAKVAVIDGCWATVGSSNIDPFSLWLAREANVVIRDNAFAAQLRERLLHTIQEGAVALGDADWKKRSWISRGATWLAYEAVRLAIGLAGYGGRH
jgi:cardiolipin synthase